MAALLGEPVGNTVGYQTRDERRIGAGTLIEVVTEGVLTRRLQHDPALEGVGLVVFDEIHERNLPTDLGLALAFDARRNLRPDLAVLAMSATPQIEPLRRVFGPAAVVHSDGRMHPVDIVWAQPAKGERTEAATAATVLRALREQTGDVLVFLPGIGEIRRVQSLLEERLPAGCDVFPLAGALSLAEHDAALAPSAPGRRRVVLSTDIAESSLTVSGVRVVVDAGLARVPRFDQRTGLTRLTTISCSRASADQRAGRAGRVEPGVCYRLWSTLEQATRRAHLDAEITQVDLAGLALELAVWGTPAAQLDFIDQPPAKAMRQGVDLLTALGALQPDGRPSVLGTRMSSLPLHPRLARMVIEAERIGHGTLGCVLATLVDERDLFRGRPDQLPADLSLRVGVLCGTGGFDGGEVVDRRDVHRLRDRAADLARRAHVRFDPSAVDPHASGMVLGFAYPDRLAVRRSQPGQFQLRSGTGAFTAPTDPLAGEQYLIVADLDGNRSGARIRLAAALDGIDVARVFADRVELVERVEWDKGRDDLMARSEIRLGSLVLEQRLSTPEPGADTTALLIERVRITRLGVLARLGEAAALRARVHFLREHLGEPWPDWSDAALVRSLDEWLAPYLVSATGADDLRRLDVAMVLSAALDWDASVRLNELAPARFTTPSGRDVTIDYGRATPTASVRVQDLFGLNVHPAVLDGRVPIALELLSPADRPVQITSDLPGFWAGSWAEVRKDMAGRYPKHQWPTDPAAATPKRLK
jgi:ATP-dependent helicase HrpB